MGALRRHWPLLLSTLLGVALLTVMGVWQLQRLQWKQGLLARIAARRDAPASAVPPQGLWAGLKPDDYDYRHVVLHGVFDHAKEAYIFRASATGAGGEGPGYEVLTPLRLDGGGVVVVNRGFVTTELKDPLLRAAGQVEGETSVTGLMRPPESRNSFTPDDQPAKNLWFTRDPAALAAHWRLSGVSPFTIDADATPNPGGWPKGGATVVNMPNNHMQYALTWFGLAAALAGFAGVSMLRGESADGDRA